MKCLDHDDFGSIRSKVINVIDSNTLEHDVVRKPLRTFRHHALEAVAKAGKQYQSCGSAQPPKPAHLLLNLLSRVSDHLGSVSTHWYNSHAPGRVMRRLAP
ncbi:hypothetical protein CAK95_00650 [Pseudorhodoplanes sinuspersici]|uniref:Uncharacterized protein n=1 Tax=Pseudorhodoplanes sinuspersici TaxID=1235591 RepID=A0A1W6ZK78_9HYPH|nr:hypothetical protein CAK95_00650 [Pseudorhodoplanes sinuspersici]